jgi:c-di-GMP-binding flagellar brake protein YcgR
MRLSAEQFAELAASFDARQPVRTHERRRAARLELHARLTIVPISDEQPQDPVKVAVCDFSARGIAILYHAQMVCGQQFVAHMPRKDGVGCVSLLCTVRHCHSSGPDYYRVGAEFTCVLPTGQLSHADPLETAQQMKRIRESMLE